MPLNADRGRCALPGEVNFFIARSRCLVGWWEFSTRLFRYFDRRCSTLAVDLDEHLVNLISAVESLLELLSAGMAIDEVLADAQLPARLAR